MIGVIILAVSASCGATSLLLYGWGWQGGRRAGRDAAAAERKRLLTAAVNMRRSAVVEPRPLAKAMQDKKQIGELRLRPLTRQAKVWREI